MQFFDAKEVAKQKGDALSFKFFFTKVKHTSCDDVTAHLSCDVTGLGLYRLAEASGSCKCRLEPLA